MHVIIVGRDDDEIGESFESKGATVTYIDGIAGRPALEQAGIGDTDLLVLTDANQGTAIPVAKELNGRVRVIVYTHDSLPEFARPQAEFIIDPDVVPPEVVADEFIKSK